LTDSAFGCILITKTDQEDNGEYKCFARSDKVEVVTKAVLTVLPKPDLPELKMAPIFPQNYRVKEEVAPIFVIPINGKFGIIFLNFNNILILFFFCHCFI
jgi:hypothetical protein